MECNQNTLPFFVIYRKMLKHKEHSRVIKSYVKKGYSNTIIKTTEPLHQMIYDDSPYIAIQLCPGGDNYNEVCRSVGACLEWFRVVQG